MRRRHIAQLDEASLQTDVMRFMAIVAFCLIAILAMVRNIEAPAPVEKADVVQVAAASPAPPPPPQAEPPAEIEDPVPQPFVPEASPLAPLLTVPPEETSAPEAEPVPVNPPPAAAEIVAINEPEPQPAAPADPEPAPAPEQEPESESEQGLTLRFASEADFLRLVARGKVAVYAFSDSSFLALQPDFRFADVDPPQQVYELQPGTIPRQMRAALAQSPHPAAMKWAVGLPRRVQRQIQEWVDTVDDGELLINRFEEVHHVALR